MSAAAPIQLLLAEDQHMVRGALAALLSLEDDLVVAAEVARGDEVLEAALRTRPDVALLDIEMPGCSGLDAAVALREHVPACRVVIVTTSNRVGHLQRAMSDGAAGFLLKDAPAARLAEAIRRVVRGERVVDPDLAARALAEGPTPLTPRETDVLRAAADGAAIADVAQRVFLSPGTVRNYLSSAIGKLAVRNRAEAVRTAEDRGWL